eukprot:XP_025012328.1 uncharacterized protein LOC8284436 isoform X2 [Ricinus communis]
MENVKQTSQRQTSSSQVDKPCTICGDIGFGELIATCSKCKIACQHVHLPLSYCMASSNGEVPEKVPKPWTCDDCHLIPDKDRCDEIGKENFQNSSNTIHHDAVRKGGPTKMSGYAGWRVHSVKTGKVKFLSTKEVIRLSAGAATDMGSPSKSNLGNRHGYSYPISPPKGKQNPSFISFSPKKPPGHGRIISSSITSQQPQRTSKDLKAIINPVKEHCWKDTDTLATEYNVSPAKRSCFKEQKITSIKPAKEVKTCNFDGLAKEEKRSSSNLIAKEVKTCNMNAQEAVNSSLASAHHLPPIITACMDIKNAVKITRCSSLDLCWSDSFPVVESKKPDVEGRDPNLCLYHPFFPALNVTWKGGFKFIDTAKPGKFYGGFQAQPPSRVSRRAYELAQKMPIVLQIELLPRHVWADVFQKDYPDFRDIALYFFPSENTERSKDNHASFFKLMEIQSSVLRTYISDVELLIFTSKQLHRDSQDVIERSGMEHFIWGVFRRAKRDQFPPELDCASTGCSDVLDMEIDMVGEQPLGRVDAVVTKESSKRAGGESVRKTVNQC